MSNRKKIKRPIKPTGLFKPGVSIIEIRHDDWCRYWQQRNPDECSCNPTLRVVRPFDRPLGAN